jgi:hypothetical protein
MCDFFLNASHELQYTATHYHSGMFANTQQRKGRDNTEKEYKVNDDLSFSEEFAKNYSLKSRIQL